MEHVMDRNVHNEHRLKLELVSAHDIFRFAVNMLDDQVEFSQAGHVILVELRESMDLAQFDAWATRILGQERHDKLAPYFLRDDHCIACERHVEDGQPRQRLKDARIACADCADVPVELVTS